MPITVYVNGSSYPESDSGYSSSPVLGVGASRVAPPAVRGKAHTFSDVSPPLPAPYPAFDVGDVLARMQGAAVRCFVGNAVYVPFLAVDSYGMPVRGITHLGTRIALFSSAGDTSPTANGVTTVSTAVFGDIVELDQYFLPGAYAYKLPSTKTSAAGFVRVRIINGKMIPITVTVQVEVQPTLSGGGSGDLTTLENLQRQTLEQTTAILAYEGTGAATLTNIGQLIQALGADLSAAVDDLADIPPKLDAMDAKLLGRWKILTDEKVLLYMDDNLNVLRAFYLYDDQGQLNARKVFKRVPLTQAQIDALGLSESDKT